MPNSKHDPRFQDETGFWFWDEAWANPFGPFPTAEERDRSLGRYADFVATPWDERFQKADDLVFISDFLNVAIGNSPEIWFIAGWSPETIEEVKAYAAAVCAAANDHPGVKIPPKPAALAGIQV